jgi:aspartyl protease family protein
VSTQRPGQRIGRVMLVLAWGAGLLLATHFFGEWQESRENPNQAPQSRHAENYVEVQLAGDGRGHFIASGQINEQPVSFLLDTGATDVAIPQAVAERLGLERGEAVGLMTANGRSEGYRTRLRSLRVGDIVLEDVRALVAPGFDGERILLGMSALRQLEFTQRDGTLVLRRYTPNRTQE